MKNHSFYVDELHTLNCVEGRLNKSSIITSFKYLIQHLGFTQKCFATHVYYRIVKQFVAFIF